MTEPANGDIGRQIGKLEGNVEALGERVSAVSENLRQLRAENAADHGEVIRRLDKMNGRLDQKAETPWVRELELRTDSLESTRDEEQGAQERDARHERRAQLYLATLSIMVGLAIGVLGVLATTGSL